MEVTVLGVRSICNHREAYIFLPNDCTWRKITSFQPECFFLVSSVQSVDPGWGNSKVWGRRGTGGTGFSTLNQSGPQKSFCPPTGQCRKSPTTATLIGVNRPLLKEPYCLPRQSLLLSNTSYHQDVLPKVWLKSPLLHLGTLWFWSCLTYPSQRNPHHRRPRRLQP